MSSCPKELERNGPTEGMTFTRKEAEKLFEHYFNKKVSWYEQGEGGLNNLIIFIQCEDDQRRYVLKIGGHVWTKTKTESEVAAIQLVHEKTTVSLPTVLSFSSNENNEFGVEWIVMTRLEGKPLRTSHKTDDTWSKLNIEQKKFIIDQLVQYICQLHQKIPQSKQIGNYKLNGQIGSDSDGRGPWNNYQDFYRDRLNRELHTLRVESIFDPVRNDVLKSIEEFHRISLPTFEDVPNVFTHNDLGVQNLIINETNQVQGIIDWEWSGSYPVCEEYFRSYKPIVYDEQLKNYLYDQLEKNQVLTPRTIPHFSLLKKMNDLLQSVAPWYLTNLANPQHPIVEKELIKHRDRVKLLVQQIKEESI